MPFLPAQPILQSGLDPIYRVASAGGDNYVPDRNEWLHVKNDGGVPTVVTLSVFSKPIRAVPDRNIAITIPAGQQRMIGALPRVVFGDRRDGWFGIVLCAPSTSVQIALFWLTQEGLPNPGAGLDTGVP